MPERIFVVGHAAVTCLGRDMDSTWQGLIEGRSGIRRHAALGGENRSFRTWGDGRGLRAGLGDGRSGDRQACGAIPSSVDGRGSGRVDATPGWIGSKASSTRTAPRSSWARRSAAWTCSRPSRIG